MKLSENIKYLRKRLGLTQDQFSKKLGVKRSAIGAYEEGRAEPKLRTIQDIAHFFKCSVDALLSRDLSKSDIGDSDLKGQHLRVLPVVVDENSELERASIVPLKAVAGYLNGYGDVDYIERLPHFSSPFPELPQDRTYRYFQLKGDSMLPIKAGDYVITTYVQDWEMVHNDGLYILVTKEEGIVFKRVLNNLKEGHFVLKSDNNAYTPYNVQVEDVVEIWKAEGFTSFALPDGSTSGDSKFNDTALILERLNNMQKDIELLKLKKD